MAEHRNVSGYVAAKLKLWEITDKLGAREAKLEPLRRKRALAYGDAMARRNKLTGGQMAEAERILARLGQDRKGAA